MIQIGNVSTSAMPVKAQAARNLPMHHLRVVSGSVISSSIVPGLPLLRPQPHRERRDQEQVEPGWKAKKAAVGLVPVEEAAQ